MTVLAAIDVEQDPERPITVGYDLATAYDDTLVVLYVMSESEYSRRQESRDELPEELQGKFTPAQAGNTAAKEAREIVDDVIGEYELDRIETDGATGDPATQILEAADDIDPRYIVVGGRKRAPAKQAIFGSVSHEVLRNADQPVVALLEDSE